VRFEGESVKVKVAEVELVGSAGLDPIVGALGAALAASATVVAPPAIRTREIPKMANFVVRAVDRTRAEILTRGVFVIADPLHR
jgi:hypothetical protein